MHIYINMKSKYYHIGINASVAFIGFISFFMSYLSFNDFKITMWGIEHYMQYDDVQGEVYASFSKFQNFACVRSRNSGILTLCSNLITFKLSGILLFIGAFTSIISSIYYIYSNSLIYKSILIQSIGPIAYVLSSIAYFSMNSGDLLDPQDENVKIAYESGSFLIIFLNFLQLASIVSYIFTIKASDSEYNPFEEPNGLYNTEDIMLEQNIIHVNYPEKILNQSPEHKYLIEMQRLEKENQKLINKLNEKSEENWQQINDLKQNIDFFLVRLKNSEQYPEISAVDKLISNFQQLSYNLLSIEKQNWQIEKNELIDNNRYLSEELEKIKSFFTKDEDTIRNELVYLEEERNLLINKIENLEKEFKKLEPDKELSENPFNQQHVSLEIKGILNESEQQQQEIQRLKLIIETNNKKLEENQQEIYDIELCKRNFKIKEEKYLKEITEMKKNIKEKEEYLFATNSSEFENEQIFALTEALKKSQDEVYKIDLKYHNSEAQAERYRKELESINNKYTESITEINKLIKEVEDINKINKNDNKTQDEISSLSSMVESLKEQDSKITEEKSIIADKYNKCKSKKKIIQRELRSANRRIVSLEALISDLEKTNTEDQDLNHQLKQDIAEAGKRFKLQEEEWERIKSELVYANSQQTKELEAMRARMKTQEIFFENELQSSQLNNGILKDQASKFEELSDCYKLECDRLRQFEEAANEKIPEDLNELKSLLIQQSEKMSENLKFNEDHLAKIIAEKEKLRKKLQTTEIELQAISEECQNLHKQRYESKYEDTLSITSFDSFSRSIHDSLIIEGISPSIIFHNPIIERISKLRKEPAMTYSTVWRTIEALMIEKLKIDKIDIDLGKEPKNVSDYIFEFMYSKYGLQALGLKQIKALITSLEELYKINHPYAVLICRILGIFHPRPIPTKIATYLFIIQEHFAMITKKNKLKSENFSEIYDIQQFGGEASIIDVVELIETIFKGRRDVGERILDKLHGDQPDKLEINLLKICGKLQRNGLNDDGFFEKLGAEDGDLDYHDFIDGIRNVFDVWITQKDAEAICDLLDDKETGIISLKNWKKKINFIDLTEKIYSKPAMVTKIDFLNSIVCEYEYQVIEDYYKLRKLIKKNSLNAKETSQYLSQIDSSLNLDTQERIFKEAAAHEGGHTNEITSEALCLIILKHNIGGYGKGLFQIELLSKI